MVNFNQKSKKKLKSCHILTFLMKINHISSIFNLFRTIMKFLIKFGNNIIDFPSMIDLDSKNFDQNFDINKNQLRIFSI